MGRIPGRIVGEIVGVIAWDDVPDPERRWRHFSRDELACHATGDCYLELGMMDALEQMRVLYGPIQLSSGYRDAKSPYEKHKAEPGPHTLGCAVDVVVYLSRQRYEIVSAAMRLGATGVGIAGTFVHLDWAPIGWRGIRPGLWHYKG